ncbi:MAG: TetR/AcrR family transcriptional regulator [Gulosibacter sp.]|uniref:TetR/AcrR family transcriptional regulator n=1 Tax=Gulosibacter sp. TaxID=2817531 RepID=UPI003F9019FD
MDPRIVRTRTAILDASIELLKTTRVADVTVASICAEAGVSRVAFYDRFGTLDAMFAALMEQELHRVRELAASMEPMTGHSNAEPPEDLVELIRIIEENGELYRAMLGESGNLAFAHHMRDAVRVAVSASLHRLPDVSTWSVDVDLYLDYVAGAVLSVILGWLDRAPQLTSAEITRQVWQLIPKHF